MSADAGAADVALAVQDDLPAEIRAHPGYAAILRHLRALDPEASLWHLYIEWNPLKGSVDPSFVLPTRAFGSIKLPLQDVADEITAGLPRRDGPGCAFLSACCAAMAARDVDDPLFPRAFSVSLEGIERAGHDADVGLVFLDFGPPIELADRPDGLAEAFADLPTPDRAAAERDIARLAEVAEGLRLDHVGAGRRRDRPVHKAYLGGRLDQLSARLLEPPTAHLVGPLADELTALGAAIEGRPAAMVIDVADGEVRRAGFELNLDVHREKNAGYAERVFDSALWSHAPDVLRAEQARALAGPVEVPLPGGYVGVLDTSHVKVSFDGSGRAEWKLYLRLQKTPGTETNAPSTDDRCA